MKYGKRITASLLALMMCAALAGCDDSKSAAETSDVSSQTASQTESSAEESSDTGEGSKSAEESVAGANDESSTKDESSQKEESSASGSEESKSENSKSESSKEESSQSSGGGSSTFVAKKASQEATDVMKHFMDAMKNADRHAVKEYSNFDVFLQTSKYMYYSWNGDDESSTVTLQDLEDELFKELEDGSISSYTILRSAQNDALRDQINDAIKELKQNISEMDSDEKDKYKEYIEILLNGYTNISECHCFEIEMKSKDGSTETEVIPVTRTSKGLKVDMLYSSALSGYTSKASITSANSAARSVYNATMAALTDMDCEDADIRQLDGTYTFKGSDFKNLSSVSITTQNRANQTELLKSLKYRIQKYFDDITELESLGFTLENGNMTAVAVQKGDYNDPVTGEPHTLYGTWPNSMKKDDTDKADTLAKALKFAKKTD